MQTKTKMKTTTRQSLRQLAKKVPLKTGLSLTRTTGQAWRNLLIEKEYEGKLFLAVYASLVSATYTY